jgi:hypothetical protein
MLILKKKLKKIKLETLENKRNVDNRWKMWSNFINSHFLGTLLLKIFFF